MGQQLAECSELLEKLRQSDPALARTIENALGQERAQRIAAEAEAATLRERLEELQCNRGHADEIVIRLLASPSMNKSSCIDPDELKKALVTVLPGA